jgi:magnesium chelatase family protein
MLASVQSCGLTGIEGYIVTVEVDAFDGMPTFELVGLPDAAVKESRERVRSAIQTAASSFPSCIPRSILRPLMCEKRARL